MGQNRFKHYLSSNLHQIWWEGVFLKVIKGSSIRFSSFWLLVLHLTPRRGQGGSNGGQKGVKWGLKVNFAPIFTKFGGKEPLCKLSKNLSIFWIWAPPFDPPRRVQGRHVGVKPYLVSDLHQIWCEVTFLQVIKGAFIFWLWFPLMTPFKLNSKDYFWIILLDRNTLDGFFTPSLAFSATGPCCTGMKGRNIYDTSQR